MDFLEAKSLEEQGVKSVQNVKITVNEFYAGHIRKAISGRNAVREREKSCGEQST